MYLALTAKFNATFIRHWTSVQRKQVKNSTSKKKHIFGHSESPLIDWNKSSLLIFVLARKCVAWSVKLQAAVSLCTIPLFRG